MKYSHKIGDVNVNIIMRGIIEDGNTEDIKEKIKEKYYFADNKWGDASSYDLCINSEIGFDNVVHIIKYCIKEHIHG